MLISIDIVHEGFSLIPFNNNNSPGYASMYSLGCSRTPPLASGVYDSDVDQVVTGGFNIAVLQFQANGSIDAPTPIAFRVSNLRHSFCMLPTTEGSFCSHLSNIYPPQYNEDYGAVGEGRMEFYPNFADSDGYTPDDRTAVTHKAMIGGALGFQGELYLPQGGRLTHGLSPFLSTRNQDVIEFKPLRPIALESYFRLVTHLEITVTDPVSSTTASSARSEPMFLLLPLELRSVVASPKLVSGLMGGTTPFPQVAPLGASASVVIPLTYFVTHRSKVGTYGSTYRTTLCNGNITPTYTSPGTMRYFIQLIAP